MGEANVLAGHRKARPRTSARFKQLSGRTPLRTKLITAVLGLVIVAIATISVAGTYMLRESVTTQHDTAIENVITNFNATQSLPRSNISLGQAAPTQFGVVLGLQPAGKQLVWAPFSSQPGMGSQDPLPQLPTSGLWPGSAVGDISPVFSVPAQSGPDTWRVMAETVTATDTITGQPTTFILVVAEDIGNINALTTRLALFDLIVGGAIVIVLASVGAAVVQTNLRPLNDIEMTAGQIAEGHLNHRIPERDPRTEIGSLGRSLNTMLSQIETAFHAQEESEHAAHQSEERMRRFIADASHELRTPLTTIRGFAAHYRQRGGAGASRSDVSVGSGVGTGFGEEDQTRSSRTVPFVPDSPNGASRGGSTGGGMSPAELDHLMGRVESEASRMGLLVEDLLTLARLDQQRPLNIGLVDLLTLAVDTVQDARIVSPDRSIDLIVAPGTAFLVNGDEPRLRQVLSNLVNNALTHTPAGTPVRVKIASGTLLSPAGGPVRTSDGRQLPAVVIDVIDDGPGMTGEQAQRVFERFYRADVARNSASGGSGLGLAIVAGLVNAHGGTVSLRTAPGHGADFEVRLPLSPDAISSDDQDI